MSPRTGELFYLRALLLHRPAYSFADIRTINNVLYPTFQEAASALGLFKDDLEGQEIMKEAIASFCSPSQFQFLFAHILLNISVIVIQLFNDCQEQFRADCLDQFDSATLVIQYCLLDLSYHLASQSAWFSDHGLPNLKDRVDKVFMEEATFFDFFD